MKKQFLLFILISLFMTNSSYAATVTGFYQCGKVLKMVEDDNLFLKPIMVGWFMGFYSGVNWVDDYNTDNPPDDDSIYYAMIKYCKENPLKDTADATVEIYNKLTK